VSTTALEAAERASGRRRPMVVAPAVVLNGSETQELGGGRALQSTVREEGNQQQGEGRGRALWSVTGGWRWWKTSGSRRAPKVSTTAGRYHTYDNGATQSHELKIDAEQGQLESRGPLQAR